MPATSSRLLAVLSLLQARPEWTTADLAARLDVSARTVRRDVDRLRELGYPIAAGRGPAAAYRLAAGARLPPLLFDDDQAVALAVSLQLAADSGTGIEEEAARALGTVRQLLPERLRSRVDAVRVTAVRPPRRRAEVAPPAATLVALGSAVRDHEELRFDYDGGTAPTGAPWRRAQPHHLLTWAGRWYLLAWDVDREDWRTYRVDRMRLRTPNGARFTPRELPGGDVTAFVLARFRGRAGWACRGEVILDLPADVVSRYAGDALVQELGPDRCRMVTGSWSWQGLAASLGRFGCDLEVVGPPELAAACAELADRYARAAGGLVTPVTP
ncbi:MAG: WYL domain-containing protein [Kineosporiaceae bacterium]